MNQAGVNLVAVNIFGWAELESSPGTYTFERLDEILDLLGQLLQEYGKTVLMVTHDPLAAARAHVVIHLEKGVLVDAEKTGQVR